MNTITSAIDFIAITGQQFTFTSAIQRVCVDIEILEDESVEDNETFTVVLLDFSVTINPNQATVQIVDNDGQFYLSMQCNLKVALAVWLEWLLIYPSKK